MNVQNHPVVSREEWLAARKQHLAHEKAFTKERDRLSGGSLAGIMQGASGRGTVGWYGPRPPKGNKPHHYHFQVLALDRQLDLPLGATRDQLLTAAAGHVIATGDLVGTYSEPK